MQTNLEIYSPDANYPGRISLLYHNCYGDNYDMKYIKQCIKL